MTNSEQQSVKSTFVVSHNDDDQSRVEITGHFQNDPVIEVTGNMSVVIKEGES